VEHAIAVGLSSHVQRANVTTKEDEGAAEEVESSLDSVAMQMIVDQ
jgi:hypothetical protein